MLGLRRCRNVYGGDKMLLKSAMHLGTGHYVTPIEILGEACMKKGIIFFSRSTTYFVK
jgi:hypothetical protein